MWYIVSKMIRSGAISDTTKLLGLPFFDWGILLFAVYAFFILYGMFRRFSQSPKSAERGELDLDSRSEVIMLGAACLAFAFFMLPTEIHERYIYPFFAFGAVLSVKKIRYAIIYFLVAFAGTINLINVFNSVVSNGIISVPLLSNMHFIMAISILYVGLFIAISLQYAWVAYIRKERRGRLLNGKIGIIQSL